MKSHSVCVCVCALSMCAQYIVVLSICAGNFWRAHDDDNERDDDDDD